MGNVLAIEHIHTYLVHPGKGEPRPQSIGGTTVRLDGSKLISLLGDIYDRSDIECDIDISFNHSTSGKQQNDCRELIIDYLNRPTLTVGRRIAKHLQGMTDRRSGIGLLFLIAGKEDGGHELLISRFPTDTAILADDDA